MKTRGIFVSAVILILAVGIGSAHAEEFYKGKFVTFTRGIFSGGVVRCLHAAAGAARMPAHIPGGPKVVVKNMTGAGGLISANYMYNRAPRDGTAVGGWGGALVLQDVLGRKAIQVRRPQVRLVGDAGPLQHGVLVQQPERHQERGGLVRGQEAGHHRRLRSGVHSVRCTEAAQRGSWIAACGSSRGIGAAQRHSLAVEMGEVDGYCGSWQTVKSIWREPFETGKIRVVIQANLQSHPELQKVPLAMDYAKTDEARELVKVLDYAYSAPFKYSVPPDVPQDRLKILQRAFVKALEDPKLLATAKKAKIEIVGVDGPTTAKIVAELYEMNAATKSKLRKHPPAEGRAIAGNSSQGRGAWKRSSQKTWLPRCAVRASILSRTSRRRV